MDNPLKNDFLTEMFNGPKLESLLWSSRRPEQPSAWHGHIAFVHWLVNVMRPRLLVELGTERGVSYSAMCHAVAKLGIPARCCAIDTWRGDAHTGSYDDRIYRELKVFNDSHYGGFSQLLKCSFDEALVKFGPGSIDLLHIDGLHTYDAVKHDFDTWLPKLSVHGVILFHDVSIRTNDFGVWRLWDELQKHYPSFSFEHSAGLGVLLTGPSPPAAITRLCNLRDGQEISNVRETFKVFSDHAYRNGLRDGQVQTLQAKVDALKGVIRSSTSQLAATLRD